MKQKPHVYIIATGGTIAGQAASASATVGYKAGELTVAQLIASVPGLERLADLSGEQLCNIDSKDMQESIWLQLARRANEIASRSDVDGIVIAHGTDTLEETAYFLQLAMHTEKPTVLTGAMRPASAISADGPMNLWQAVRTAADENAEGRGVLVVMNGQIDAAKNLVKTNANTLQTFRSVNSGPEGVIVGEKIFWQRKNYFFEEKNFPAVRENKIAQAPENFSLKQNSDSLNKNFSSKNLCDIANKNFCLATKYFFSTENISCLPDVKIIYGYVGGDDQLFFNAALQNGAKGIVYAACGNGSVPEKLEDVLKKAASSGVPVVIASRCSEGIVALSNEVKENLHCIGSGTLNPQKAKILLQLALTKTNDVNEIKKIFEDERNYVPLCGMLQKKITAEY